MTHTEKLSHWAAEINRHFPSLSSPQSRGLALWSTGMVLAGNASLEMVALRLHIWLAETGKSLDALFGNACAVCIFIFPLRENRVASVRTGIPTLSLRILLPGS